MTIAIVGNSPKILEKEWGSEIDSHDEVLRFNEFQINGFEKYVGSKITMLSVCCATRNYKYLDKFMSLEKDHRFLAAGGSEQKVQEDLNRIFNGKVLTSDITYPDIKIFNLIKQRMPDYCKDTPQMPGRFASSGIIMMEYIVDKFPNATIDAYGFTFFNETIEHYYNKNSRTRSYHDKNAEKQYFETYLADKINLHI